MGVRLWAAIALWVLCVAFSWADGFIINRFDTAVKLNSNGSMRVEESIQVTFLAPRRGIFRVIPVDYDTGRGFLRRVQLSSFHVDDGTGNKTRVKISRQGNNVNIRIGDPDITLPEGTQRTYRIRYTALGMMNWFDASSDWEPNAELYWNATGNEWDVAIEQSSVSVTFPQIKADDPIRARVFAGAYGSSESNQILGIGQKENGDTATTVSLTSNTLEVQRIQPLYPGEGLTFVLTLPASSIAKPSFWQQMQLFLIPNLGFGLPLLALLFMPLAWWRYGRDPKSGPMVVSYEPPEGMSGPLIGTFYDQRIDRSDLAALFVSLAVKGKIQIIEDLGGHSNIKVIKESDESGLDSAELKLYQLLKLERGLITRNDLRECVAPHLSNIQHALFQDLIDRGYYQHHPTWIKAGWTLGGMAVLGALGFVIFAMNPLNSPLHLIIGGGLAALITFGFAQYMPKRTVKGARVLGRVAGFRDFILRAKEKELEWMAKKEPSAALFEEYLPHAMAFGLVKQWTRAFEGVLVEPPDWYVGYAGRPFYFHTFGDSLSDFGNEVGHAAVTPPRSDGASGGGSGWSGGGGFSGGGFGGGGGGSW